MISTLGGRPTELAPTTRVVVDPTTTHRDDDTAPHGAGEGER